MNFHILTLFPDMILQGLSTSIIGRATEEGLLSIEAVDIRDYTQDKHKKVDDYPYGGGAGMLMQAQPIYDAWKSIADRTGKKPRTVYLTPQGTTFSQPMAKELAREEDLVLLCGHYEGIDERVLEEIVTDYVSIGDYVLTGGELPAMVMVDAISRMVPGVLGNEVSGETESFEGNLLEYPQYSRPEIWMGKAVPEVLLSGNQKNIRAWRREEAIKRTRERRPDLYKKFEELDNCREILQKKKLLHIDMTELIKRGQAELIYAEEDTICLRDVASGIYFHAAENEEAGRRGLEQIRLHAGVESKSLAEGASPSDEGVALLVLHQDFMIQAAKELLGMQEIMSCYQAVYTRREKLPITGLYRMDGKRTSDKAAAKTIDENAKCTTDKNCREQITIKPLTLEHLPVVEEHYETVDDPTYIKESIEKGSMFGAFLEDELAGFVGMHTEGSLGMLQVLPAYKGRKIGKALETYVINHSLELGHIPYGQVKDDNEISMRLQESLGLCFSKQKIYWMEHPEKL